MEMDTSVGYWLVSGQGVLLKNTLTINDGVLIKNVHCIVLILIV